MNCQHHNEQQYVYICITNHPCQRKFCAICFEEHQKQNPGINYTNIQNFFTQAKQAFNDLDVTQINFKNNLQSLQRDFTKLLDKIRDSFLFLIGDLNQIGQEYQIMKDKLNNSTIDLLTNQDLNKIVEVLNSNILQYLKQQKNKINRVLKKIEETIAQKLSKMMEWFGNFAVQKAKSIITYKGKKIQLIGPKILGLEHGEYEYNLNELDDERDHVKAGRMFFNQKIGNWKVLKSLKNNKQKELKWYNIRYEYGKEIIENVYEENNILLPGELNQQKLKEGKFYYINQNEIVVDIHFRHEKTGSWKINEMQLFDQRYLLKDCWGGLIQDGHNIGKWIENEEMHNGYDIIHFQSRGYYLNGQKEGKWTWVKVLFGQEQNNNNQEGNKSLQYNLVCWEGEYQQGLKKGQWSMYFNDRFIGYGTYDDQQKKTGYWKETDIEFLNKQNQNVYFEGNYKEDLRIGEWFIYFEGEKIGGGSYEQGVKYGIWRDIEIKYCGIILHLKEDIFLEKEQDNGKYTLRRLKCGGNYNENGLKIGKWKDINNQYFSEKLQVTFEGEYNNGTKVGLWQLFYKNQCLGGGHYNNQGKRQGIWKEFRINKNCDTDRIPFEAEYQNGVEIWSRGPQIVDAYKYVIVPY